MLSFILNNVFQPYYITIFIAILISYICINLLEKLSNLDRLYLLSCYVFSLFGMLLGAKILCIMEIIICNKAGMVTIFNGFSYMGGVLGYIAFIKIYNIIYKNFPKKINTLLLFAIPIIYSISKIGCYINGCCNGVTNIPLQLIECLVYFIIFIVFFYLYKKLDKKELIASLSLILLCVCRCIIDFFRIERELILFNFTLTQIICIVIIIKTALISKKSGENHS